MTTQRCCRATGRPGFLLGLGSSRPSSALSTQIQHGLLQLRRQSGRRQGLRYLPGRRRRLRRLRQMSLASYAAV